MRRKQTLALALTFLSFASACAARKPGDPIKPGFNVFSKEQDIQLGREAAQQIAQQVDIVDNRALQSYIDRVGKRLASQPAAGGYPYEFTLINDKSINAFALPGGPIFVHSGLISNSENEAQLAGVLAHEIAHVALRHGTNQASKANLLQLPAALASAVIGQGSLAAQLGQLGLGLGLNSVLLKYSRDAETQADALGARIMSQAGYNPLEMARFFEKLQAQGGSRAPQFLSSHPDPGNRERAVSAEVRALPRANYDAGTGDFANARQQVAQLPAPRRPRQLQQARQAAPAPQQPGLPDGSMRSLRASRYSMSYPANWQAYGDQQSAMVTIAPQQGLVQTRDGSVQIGYGAMVNYYFPSTGRDLTRGTRELLGKLQAANPGMRIAANPQRARIDGADAIVTQLSAGSPYGGEETNVLVTVMRPEGMFYMVLVAPTQAFRQMQPAFQGMLQSIRFES
ncbi:MAG: M48 family metallopeptidase [Bryobacteraceae bacterium]|nr:M48 family metallopeptidase [Bryobacteraceae bacterium]